MDPIQKHRITSAVAMVVVVGWLLAYNGYRLSDLDQRLTSLANRTAVLEGKAGIVPAPAKPAAITGPVESILVSRCQRCHLPTSQAVAAGFAPALFTSGGAVVEPDKTLRIRIYEVARNGIMPPRKDLDGSALEPLTDDEFLAVKTWLFPGPH